jgi:hypothetical protein
VVGRGARRPRLALRGEVGSKLAGGLSALAAVAAGRDGRPRRAAHRRRRARATG